MSPPPPPPARRKKIAILGGGVGAITAAFELTQEPGWEQKYEITVHQLGWRLGGKGASGRDRKHGDRIYEHGLHVWGGYYDNAFRVMRQCYDALQRPPEVPIRTVEQAFLGVNQVFLSDFVDDHPHFWRVDFPPNDEPVGRGGVFLTPRDYLVELIEGLKDLIERFPVGAPALLEAFVAALPEAWSETLGRLQPENLLSHVHLAGFVVQGIAHRSPRGPLHQLVERLLEDFLRHLARQVDTKALNPTLAAVLAALEIGAACAKGMLADHVLTQGFDPLDDLEWSDWVMKHGASRRALESSVGRCSYDYVFGSRSGRPDFGHRAVAAGTGLRALLRLLFTYKGALFFKLNAGMGDIVFAPMYELLKRRGVRFCFFHQVTNLGLSADGRSLDTIAIDVQATVKHGAEYDPLYPVNGLPCWPSEPFFEQLDQGDALQAQHIDLESMYSGWQPVEQLTLKAGVDFDLCVLGISLGGLPAVARELIERHPPWRAMVAHIKTVATQSMQFWFREPLQRLGWVADSGILTGYYEPMDTWSDMSFLLPSENWPKGHGPKQISYFCTVYHPDSPAPPFGKSEWPQRQLDAVKRGVQPWLDRRLTQLLPHTAGAHGRFDEGTLFAPGEHGPGRLDAQYFRVNVDPPSELYVQSVPGSTRYRMTADGSGVRNLFLAGDWLRTGINAGCVEAAAMGGLQAARAISGRDIAIVGESDLADPPLSAQNAQLPWSLAYAVGEIRSAVMTIALPVGQVKSMLPPGLVLLPQSTAPAGQHPVGLIFAEQRRVHATVLPSLTGMDYRECAIAIPFVARADDASPHPVPLMTLPALYLDSVKATLAGRVLYGYRKHLARMSGPGARQSIRTLFGDAPVFTTRLVPEGPGGSYYDYANLGAVRAMMSQPIVTRDPLRGWLYSFMDYRFEQARIAPLRGSLDVGAGVLGQAAATRLAVPSILHSPLGAFEFDGAWTLTNPLETWALQRALTRP